MIINNPLHSALKVYGEQTKPIKKDKPEGKETGAAGSLQQRDQVILSAKAQQLGSVQQALKTMPEVRTNLVNELRQKIQNGTYQVSGDAIAQKMITGEKNS